MEELEKITVLIFEADKSVFIKHGDEEKTMTFEEYQAYKETFPEDAEVVEKTPSIAKIFALIRSSMRVQKITSKTKLNELEYRVDDLETMVESIRNE